MGAWVRGWETDLLDEGGEQGGVVRRDLVAGGLLGEGRVGGWVGGWVGCFHFLLLLLVYICIRVLA